MNITLRNITIANFYQAVKLKVLPEQEKFVASVTYSIAQTSVLEEAYSLLIYKDDEPVGYSMYDCDEGKWWMDRFLIDHKYQYQGIGSKALALLIEHIKTNHQVKELYTSFVPGNEVAKHVYQKSGFIDTGEIQDGECVFCLKL